MNFLFSRLWLANIPCRDSSNVKISLFLLGFSYGGDWLLAQILLMDIVSVI